MFKIIIGIIIGNILYSILKKGIKFGYELYKIKKNTNNLQKIINNVTEKQNINKFFDNDFWEEK